MSKLILLEQLHIDLLVARNSKQSNRAARIVRSKVFLDDVQKAIQAEVRQYAALKDVVARVTR